MTKEKLIKEQLNLIKSAEALIELYIANPDTVNEFISCITPKHASAMTFQERRKDRCWRAWDNLREAVEKARGSI